MEGGLHFNKICDKMGAVFVDLRLGIVFWDREDLMGGIH